MSTFWIVFLCLYGFVIFSNIYSNLLRRMLGIQEEHKAMYRRLVQRIGIGPSMLIGLMGIVISLAMIYTLSHIIVLLIGG